MENKSIDINQRIPLEVLHAALEAYLNDSYSNEYVLEQLQLEFKGQNRLKKALRIVNKIIINNPQITFINENKELIQKALRAKSDRNVILISLLNIAFPFSFDVLSSFSKFFNVQNIINSETVKKTISNVYGGNRATENGIYSVVPMFLEAEIFNRPKQGIYEYEKPTTVSSQITFDLYKKSYTSNSKSNELNDPDLFNPYFSIVRYIND